MEQHIKERKNAIRWTRLSCRKFRNNEVRLQLHVLAYNLGNFMRTLALPKAVEHWSLTTLREKLIKIRAKVVSHVRYITFQLAEVAVPRELFRKILHLIDGLWPSPLPPRQRPIQYYPGRPTGQVCAAQVEVRPQNVEWSPGQTSHHQISPIKYGLRPIMTAQGWFRGWMPILLSLLAFGSSYPGNPGSTYWCEPRF